MRISTHLMAIVATACVALAGVAYATDEKVIPGYACKPQSEGSPVFSSFAGIINKGPANVTIVCPIVRDNTQRLSARESVKVEVNVDTEGKLLTCILGARGPDGQIPDANDSTASTTVAGPRILELSVEQNFDRGYYGLQCILPPAGRVISYLVIEPTPTDNDN